MTRYIFLRTVFGHTFLFISVSRARILGDRDVLVQVGSDINLTCRAEESPEAPSTVTWFKDEIRVDNLLVRGGISVVTESRRRSSNLLVSKVTKADAGNYTCAPTNAKADSVMVHVIDGKLLRNNFHAFLFVSLPASNTLEM